MVLQECERVTININGIYRIYFGHLRTTVAAYKMWSQMIQYFMFVHRSLEEWEMGENKGEAHTVPKIRLNLCIKTEPIADGAEATGYVRLWSTYVYLTQTSSNILLYLLQP